MCSGSATRARVTPGWPFCPPGYFPLGWHSVRGGGFLKGGSEEGGLRAVAVVGHTQLQFLDPPPQLSDLRRLFRHLGPQHHLGL